MNQSAEKVLSYLTGNENINSVTTEDLEKLVAENPYFPISHFLLAQKVKGKNGQQYSAQLQKTALYFSNPFWLHYQLSAGETSEQERQLAELRFEPGSDDSIAKSEVSAQEEKASSSSEDLTIAPTPVLEVEAERTSEASAKYEDDHQTDGREAINDIETVDSGDRSIDTAEDLTESQDGQALEETVLSRDTNEEPEGSLKPVEPTPVTSEHTAATLPDDLPPAAEAEVIELEEEMAGVTHAPNEVIEQFLDDATHEQNNVAQPEDDEHDKMFKNIKAMLDASTEEADADTKNTNIPIDPYFTIDYFASQGIKLELDQNPKDQLGQNLKKFTQWLKHMKKLGPEDATEAINRTETEADIQQIADSSNTVREVVTEAMATVLEKQGKKDKAIELYNKLSFLNPDKSTYFAGKINKLKGI